MPIVKLTIFYLLAVLRAPLGFRCLLSSRLPFFFVLGLFQGAILESGSCLSPWSYQRNSRTIAFATAAILNSTFETNNDSQALLEFLQSVDARDLDAAAQKYVNDVNYKINNKCK